MAVAAQARPAPNATHTTRSPFCTRPSSIASARAIGTDADEVLP